MNVITCQLIVIETLQEHCPAPCYDGNIASFFLGEMLCSSFIYMMMIP